jgi:hypothetical protein
MLLDSTDSSYIAIIRLSAIHIDGARLLEMFKLCAVLLTSQQYSVGLYKPSTAARAQRVASGDSFINNL